MNPRTRGYLILATVLVGAVSGFLGFGMAKVSQFTGREKISAEYEYFTWALVVVTLVALVILRKLTK